MARGTDPRRSTYGDDYWLRRCEGFRVFLTARRVGTVRGVRFGISMEPQQLEVKSGRFRRRVVLIPVEEIAQIDPVGERITLRGSG